MPQISLVAGVAAHDAIAETLPIATRLQCRLKWPNDVLISGAKVSGILIESTVLGRDAVVAIGTGINIGAVPVLADRATTALSAAGSSATFEAVAQALARALARWIETWACGDGFGGVREAWLARAGPLGEAMTVRLGSEQVAGEFAGLDTDGALLLRDASGATRKFSFGDVALAGPRV